MMDLLHKLIKIGDLNGFIDALEGEISIENRVFSLTTNYSGMNCLHACCINGQYEILEYILELDCIQINIKCYIDLYDRDHKTCLILACWHKYYRIVKLLLDHGADTNKQFGGALRYAALNRHLDVFKLLLEYGAEMPKWPDSNLIYAFHAEPSILNYIINMKLYTKLEEIEALEVLGCMLIIDGKLDQGVSFLKRALTERIKYPKDYATTKVLQGFENVKQYQTIEELDEMRDNLDLLLIQSFLLLKKIFPTEYGLKTILTYISAICTYFKTVGDYNKLLVLRLNSIDTWKLFSEYSFWKTIKLYEEFLELFRIIMEHKSMSLTEIYMHFEVVFSSYCKQIQIFYDCLTFTSVVYLTEDYHRFNELFILFGLYLLFFSNLDADDFVKENFNCIKKSIYEIVRVRDMKSFEFNQTILHTIFAIKEKCQFKLKPSTYLNLVKLLLECGVSVNATTHDGNNVLHYAMSQRFSKESEDEAIQFEIISYLLNSGAHLDARNSKNETPLDLCSSQAIFNFIKPIKYTSLKCICASKIRQFNIPYVNIVPESIEKFVSYH